MTELNWINLEFSLSVTVLALLAAQTTNWIVRLPGTIAHEGLHWIVGLITNARPVAFRITPQENSLGQVSFLNVHWANALPVALAPVLIYPLVMLAWPWLTATRDTLFYLPTIWATAVMLLQGMPSQQDLDIARQFKLGSLAWITALIYLLWRTL